MPGAASQEKPLSQLWFIVQQRPDFWPSWLGARHMRDTTLDLVICLSDLGSFLAQTSCSRALPRFLTYKTVRQKKVVVG